MNAYAYVQEDGQVAVETVSPTERAAMVNTIYTASFGNMMPSNAATDEQIRALFINATGGVGAVKPVVVSVATAH